MINKQFKVIWMYGLSGSGKTTQAQILEENLNLSGYRTFLIDGDMMRLELSDDLEFSNNDRNENIRRASHIIKFMSKYPTIVIASFMTPFDDQRELIRSILGESVYFCYVKCSVNKCEDRDVKGLYNKFNNGEIKYLIGKDVPIQVSSNNDIVIDTDNYSVSETAYELFKKVEKIL